MLNSIEDSIRGNRVKIEMAEDETGKAHGNITGSYGQKRGNPSKARDFFGFKSEKDLARIINTVKAAGETRVETAPQIDLAAIRAAIQNIDFGFDE
jgi:hypothetical protein